MRLTNLFIPTFTQPKRYVFTWGEISTEIHGPSLHLSDYGDDCLVLVLGFVLFTMYIHLPKFLESKPFDTSWGFSFTYDALHAYWGRRMGVFYYPWTLDYYKRWERVDEAVWAPRGKPDWVFLEMPRGARDGIVATKHKAPYTYKLKSGEIQERTATFYIDRYEWRRRIWPWAPWFNKRVDLIEVSFDDEVGERTGSWKGGTIGCGYDMRPGETGLQTLRRMERERKF